ncbi:patatin-like phospholipase family protein [Candidatus Protochlamydia phocaeensis]|uniref:patatin-like phospholipase family protein n=1 Tax=Candidatus Protochlamydia phocaeensis TaxID=1414722 RepID=UPI0009AD56C7|nr:patatin-like phospholipase family protein [Candidatus Protochlamydia phocaeensis]
MTTPRSFAFTSRYFLSYLCLIGFVGFFLSSCDTKYDLPDPPCQIPQCIPPTCVRLALVLGGGGARGMAHIGVLYEFEKAGIPIDAIIGCSAGSIVGALYADCPHAYHLRHILEPLKKWDVLDINIWNARYGLVQGWSLRRFLNRHLHCRYFEQLRIPLYIAATDLLEGRLVCISSGQIIPAVHASAAVPLVFAPVPLYDRLLVDGGVADPVPVAIAKQINAQIVVAVDLSEMLPKTCPTNLFGVATRSAEIKFLLQSESCVKEADVIIRPELGDIGLFDDRNNELAFEAGCKAAREAIPHIIELLSQNGFWCEPCCPCPSENEV